MKPIKCAYCGKRVLRANGFFRTWPDPIALHHGCVNPYSKAGNQVTAGAKGQAEVYWDATVKED